MFLRFLILVLFSSVNLLFAQSDGFIDIDKNFKQKTEFENSNVFLEDKDSLSLTGYKFESNQPVKLEDSTKIVFYKLKTTFGDFKFKIGIEKFNPELKKNSEYLFKYESKEKNRSYEIFLNDSVSKTQIIEFNDYLKKNFKLEKIEFISKKEAAKKAKEILGVDSESLFEENIFPASFQIESKSKINIEEIKMKYSNIIDDILNKNQDIGVIIMKVETQ